MSGDIGGTSNGQRFRRAASKLCSLQSWKRRVPITIWLPNYKLDYLARDAIAGITVGLTSIPQGIAYALVAGVPPQVGLYSSAFPGFVYAVFGSCKDVTVGPTAILSALLAKYVAQSVAFAYLAAFLSGCLILLLGVLQLGFLLDFISKPVISGFTTAAALQIAASQLRSLFRIDGKSGDTFISALINFFKHFTSMQLWDSLLGITCIISLYLIKCLHSPRPPPPPAAAPRRVWRACAVYVVRARNALVVFAATALAYALHAHGLTPLALTGKIEGGLPHFGLPPFSTTVNNATVNFDGMLEMFGAEGLVMPLVAILESIAIAKAFAGNTAVDNTQEMIAVGACNVLASCCQSMPATGSFTRTALNHASGVATPAGSLFKASLVLLAVSQLSGAFGYIPRAALAAVIVTAMASIVDGAIVRTLYTHTKTELCVYVLTVCVGVTLGLEYGILAGAGADAGRALARAARPHLRTTTCQVGNQECVFISLVGTLSYASAEYVGARVRGAGGGGGGGGGGGAGGVLVMDGRLLKRMDIGVAENLASAIQEVSACGVHVLLWEFPEGARRLLEDIAPALAERMVSGPSIDRHVLALPIERRETDYGSNFIS